MDKLIDLLEEANKAPRVTFAEVRRWTWEWLDQKRPTVVISIVAITFLVLIIVNN